VMEFGLHRMMLIQKGIKSIFVRNRPATEPVMLKVHNVKLSGVVHTGGKSVEWTWR